MRVIAGRYRSQPLSSPKGWKTRPTSDQLRETLFNVLASHIPGAAFADLFAGTGAVGIEALSRGAERAWFSENGRPAITALRENLSRLRIGPEAELETGGTLPLLRRLERESIRLNVVFLDPPYSDAAAYQQTLEFLAAHPVLAENAVVVAEHSRREALAPAFGLLAAYRTIEKSESALTFFRRDIPSF